jgi:hypothetical protein
MERGSQLAWQAIRVLEVRHSASPLVLVLPRLGYECCPTAGSTLDILGGRGKGVLAEHWFELSTALRTCHGVLGLTEHVSYSPDPVREGHRSVVFSHDGSPLGVTVLLLR